MPTITFSEAASAYVGSGGSPRFLFDIDAKGKEQGLAVTLRKRLIDIDQDFLDRKAAEMYPNVLPETLVRQFYTPFRAVWRFAVLQEWAKEKKWKIPTKRKGTGVTSLRSKRTGNRPTSYDRAALFVSEMSPAPAMFMTTLFYTGMRPIELFALECTEVNLDARWIVLETTKTGEPRGVPIHEFLVPIFASLLPRGGKVFRTFRGKEYQPKDAGGGQIKTAIIGARERSGIKDISPYTARHTVSTQLVVNGVHPHIKDQILGHAPDDMSRHYTHVPQAPLIEAINTLPVPAAWHQMWWLADPFGNASKPAPGAGARNDLKEKRA